MKRIALITGCTVGILGIVGAFLVHRSMREEDPRRREFYSRVLGIPTEPASELASCTTKSIWSLDGTDFYAFRLPESAAKQPSLMLPQKAAYQARHTLVRWHACPATSNDRSHLPAILKMAKQSLRGQCSRAGLNLLGELQTRLDQPGCFLSYSYMRFDQRAQILTLYVLDPTATVFYVLRYAV